MGIDARLLTDARTGPWVRTALGVVIVLSSLGVPIHGIDSTNDRQSGQIASLDTSEQVVRDQLQGLLERFLGLSRQAGPAGVAGVAGERGAAGPSGEVRVVRIVQTVAPEPSSEPEPSPSPQCVLPGILCE